MNKIMLALVAMLLVAGSAFAADNKDPIEFKDKLTVKAHVPNICLCKTLTYLDFGDIRASDEPKSDGDEQNKFGGGHKYGNKADAKIKVACTKGSIFRVGLGGGENPLAYTRQMKGEGKGDFLAYALHHNSVFSYNSLWGSGIVDGIGDVAVDPLGTVHPHGDKPAEGTGEEQSFKVVGFIPSMKLSELPKADKYKDVVAVTVYF